MTPAAEALREPTMATSGIVSAAPLPPDGDERRRVIDHCQPVWIIVFAERDENGAEFLRGGDLLFRLGARADVRRAAAAAAAGKPRQRLKRRSRAAEMIDQCAERPRPDILAANEPQPVEPLLIGQADGFCQVVQRKSPQPLRRAAAAAA